MKMKTFFITGLSFMLFIFSASASYLYANDERQARAIEQIRGEIARAISLKDSSPIQAVLRRYKIRDAVAFFGRKNEYDSYEIANFLPKKRPAKITLGEWLALKKSRLTLADSENNRGAFTLLDLDEDGARDLIVETYAGGTGLFSYVHVYPRRGDRFVIRLADNSIDEEGELYSINGRGGDQEADWVRIGGRIYLAYRDGAFGRDELFLIRALARPPKKTKGLIVEYDYRHNLPPRQKTDGQDSAPLDADFYAALQKGLDRIERESAGSATEIDFGKCAAPENFSAAERERYDSSWFGPPHYTYEVAAEFPIFEKEKCYMARLVDFKGGYSIADNRASTALWLLRRPDGAGEEYEVESVRTARSVKSADLEYPPNDDF